MGTSKQPVVSLISLGCAKNTVDSERILGQLVTSGFLVAEDPAEADICLVNTCGFIHDAREESAGVLEQVRGMKKSGRLKAVVALGCLVERAQSAGELGAFLDAADTRIGFQDYPGWRKSAAGLRPGPGGPRRRMIAASRCRSATCGARGARPRTSPPATRPSSRRRGCGWEPRTWRT